MEKIKGDCMTEIPNEVNKKPVKQDFEYFANSPYCKECEDQTRCQQCGFWMDYDQAIDRYEKFLPSNDELRTIIVKHTSEMLDNPDKYGIYPTTKFYNNLINAISRRIGRTYG